VKIALYARVSTGAVQGGTPPASEGAAGSRHGQDPEVQLAALRAHAVNRGWTLIEEFVDRGVSGTKDRRPALDRLMQAAWAGRFQAVLVWRFDRFARSVKHLIGALETFQKLNIEFISLQEQFDTSTPIGRAMFTIIGAMAELERDIIRERVKAGLAQARARGIRLGRPSVPVDPRELETLRSHGLSIRQIAGRVRSSAATVRRRLRQAERAPAAPGPSSA
jgi:DNA invertase Pin-like site-specific DNA recombinase